MQANGLEQSNDPVEFVHVSIPVLEACRLRRSQGDVDGLPCHLSGPHAIRSAQLWRVSFAPARWGSASKVAECDTSAEHQADVRELGRQGAMALFEALERGFERCYGNFRDFCCFFHSSSIHTIAMESNQFSPKVPTIFTPSVSTALMPYMRVTRGGARHTMTVEAHP